MEREFAIQSQITEAARRLASDPHVSSKKLKKQRKTSYLNALKKLQEIENSINEYRVRSGKKPTQRASLIIEGTNTLLLSVDLYQLRFFYHMQHCVHTLFRVVMGQLLVLRCNVISNSHAFITANIFCHIIPAI